MQANTTDQYVAGPLLAAYKQCAVGPLELLQVPSWLYYSFGPVVSIDSSGGTGSTAGTGTATSVSTGTKASTGKSRRISLRCIAVADADFAEVSWKSFD